jgi:glucose/arabinose dehydrogenase
MLKRAAAAFVASLVSAGGLAAVAAAAGPPPPKTYHGAKVSLYAGGMDNPTSFAWGDGAMFAGDSGNSNTTPNGGVYVIRNHVAAKIPSNVIFVGGMQFHNGVLYISAGDIGNSGPQFQILAWSGWNGSTFAKQKVVYTAPKGFQGFNGIAFGPDGRLYVGVDAGLLNGNDHGPSNTSPYVYDVLSMTSSGKQVKVFARGIRQPWQLAFAPGSSSPFASDLGQDSGSAKNPPDFILKLNRGDNYGFPKCNHTKGSPCKTYTKPFKTLPPHWDPMGITVLGGRLYVGSFLGSNAKSGGALYSMALTGGSLTPVVTGFPLATDALAAHAGALFVGGQNQTGQGFVEKVTLGHTAKKKATKKTASKKGSTSPSFTG